MRGGRRGSSSLSSIANLTLLSQMLLLLMRRKGLVHLKPIGWEAVSTKIQWTQPCSKTWQ